MKRNYKVSIANWSLEVMKNQLRHHKQEVPIMWGQVDKVPYRDKLVNVKKLWKWRRTAAVEGVPWVEMPLVVVGVVLPADSWGSPMAGSKKWPAIPSVPTIHRASLQGQELPEEHPLFSEAVICSYLYAVLIGGFCETSRRIHSFIGVLKVVWYLLVATLQQ
jgi:hypothetical protein